MKGTWLEVLKSICTLSTSSLYKLLETTISSLSHCAFYLKFLSLVSWHHWFVPVLFQPHSTFSVFIHSNPPLLKCDLKEINLDLLTSLWEIHSQVHTCHPQPSYKLSLRLLRVKNGIFILIVARSHTGAKPTVPPLPPNLVKINEGN